MNSEPIQILIVHDGVENNNPLAFVFAREPGVFPRSHVTVLTEPPLLPLQPNIFILRDDPHTPRYQLDPLGTHNIPSWANGAVGSFKIGPETISSPEDMRRVSHLIERDAKEFLKSRSARPQSAVMHSGAAEELRQ